MYKESFNLPKYGGYFKDELHAFIDEKRAVGYKYNIESQILCQFDKLSMEFPEEKTLSKELVTKWNKKRSYEQNRNHLTRISVLRQFAIYLRKIGNAAYIPPTSVGKSGVNKYIPHIYTNEELCAFFKQVDAYEQRTISKNQHLAKPLIFRLLYGCGLRISEALSLRVCDVDTDSGILTIMQSKFDKRRYVPVAPSLNERLRSYAHKVLLYADAQTYFFESPCGGRYSNRAIYDSFRKILWRAGISHGGRGHGPRIHDFRHTFAVHCLRQWVKNGVDINAAIPYLSSYMGHSDFESTQFYLRLTADMFPYVVEMLGSKFGDIVPATEGCASL